MNLDDLLPSTPQTPKETIYTYSDGNANSYYIGHYFLQYEPVSAKWSSSGSYNGGDPAKKRLNAEQFEAIKVIIEQAINTTEDHRANRVKMSGYLQLKKEKKAYILGAQTSSKKILEALLIQLLKQDECD